MLIFIVFSRYRKERWIEGDKSDQVDSAVNNDDAAEGGTTQKKGGKKSKVEHC